MSLKDLCKRAKAEHGGRVFTTTLVLPSLDVVEILVALECVQTERCAGEDEIQSVQDVIDRIKEQV